VPAARREPQQPADAARHAGVAGSPAGGRARAAQRERGGVARGPGTWRTAAAGGAADGGARLGDARSRPCSATISKRSASTGWTTIAAALDSLTRGAASFLDTGRRARCRPGPHGMLAAAGAGGTGRDWPCCAAFMRRRTCPRPWRSARLPQRASPSSPATASGSGPTGCASIGPTIRTRACWRASRRSGSCAPRSGALPTRWKSWPRGTRRSVRAWPCSRLARRSPAAGGRGPSARRPACKPQPADHPLAYGAGQQPPERAQAGSAARSRASSRRPRLTPARAGPP
jgi:hypothetical protein